MQTHLLLAWQEYHTRSDHTREGSGSELDPPSFPSYLHRTRLTAFYGKGRRCFSSPLRAFQETVANPLQQHDPAGGIDLVYTCFQKNTSAGGGILFLVPIP